MSIFRRGRRGRIRPLPLLLILSVLLILGSAFGGWRWLMTSLPLVDGQLKVLGLSQPVTISRDAHGVPSIQAQTETDAYFALGFVHAQDRLWQMDLQRRIAQGRLSEIAGKAALGNDRFFRVLGLEGKTESSFEHLDESTRQDLIAYAEGVNAWIASLDSTHKAPPEFILAGIHPKPWRPADSLLWPRVMAMQLAGNWRDELLNLTLADHLDETRARELSPMQGDTRQQAALSQTTSLLAALPLNSETHLASNVWAISGGRSATGAPLLANDPHLGFQAPIMWYLARVEAPGLWVQGSTIPGQPFIILGQNRQVAWGLTSSHSDTMDLFYETLDATDPNRYMTPEGPVPFAIRHETISVKGETDIRFDVRETRHGPVISDVLNNKEVPTGTILSLASTALNAADTTAQAFRKMSMAENSLTFRQALADFQAPAEYVAYAGTDDQIGLQLVGLIPLRAGTASSDLPRHGADGSADWTGFIPFEQLPAVLNPAEGVVLNANDRLQSSDYPHHLASNWPEPLRAERLAELLSAKPLMGADDMSAFQMDNLSMAFRHLKPYLTELEPASADGQKAVAQLKAWDGSMAGDLIEPTLFSAWAEEIQRALFADDLRKIPDKDPGDLPSPFEAWSTGTKPLMIEAALNGDGFWCDNIATNDHQETCKETILRALDEALRRLRTDLGSDMSRWSWSSVHIAKFKHGILERLPLSEKWVAPSIATDGDSFSLNRGTFAFGNFRHVHGAGLRAVYDVKNPAASRFILATGQSGNPLSSHYDDQIGLWRKGGYVQLDDQGKASELVLWPVQAGK